MINHSHSHQPDLILIGIQGCGKGTQAKRLSQHYRHFETGGALRDFIQTEQTPLAHSIRETMRAGNLVSTEMIIDMTRATIRNLINGTPMLFDGMPRTVEQKEALDVLLSEQGRMAIAIHLVLEEEEAKSRIQIRAKEEGRADDADMRVVEKRFETFREKTMPVVEAYSSQGVLFEIDAKLPQDEVTAQIMQIASRQPVAGSKE